MTAALNQSSVPKVSTAFAVTQALVGLLAAHGGSSLVGIPKGINLTYIWFH